MNTLILIFIFIVIYLLFSKLIGIPLFNIVGILGSMIGFKSKNRKEFRYILGFTITLLMHLYFYLAFMIYIIEWARLKIDSTSWAKYILWFFCMVAVVGPAQAMYKNGKKEFKDEKIEYLNIQVDSLFVVEFLAFITFFILVFFPQIEIPLWRWVKNIGYPI